MEGKVNRSDSSEQDSKELQGVSVVVPTMNRPEVLLDTVRDLLAQRFLDYEIIVIDQSDVPNEAARTLLASSCVPARYFHVTHFRGLPEARNFGLRVARRDIVLYTDDDIRCEPGFLQAHFDAHLHSGAVMVAGGITERKGNRTVYGATGSFNRWTANAPENFHHKMPGYCVRGKGCNFSIRRSALLKVGGFDENLNAGAALYEETELALRLRSIGGRCWFAPEAHLIHLSAPSGGCRVGPDLNRYMYGMAHNRALLIHRHLFGLHRLVASFRTVLYGLSYSRVAGSLAPLRAAVRGMREGRRAARSVKSEIGKELTCAEGRAGNQ